VHALGVLLCFPYYFVVVLASQCESTRTGDDFFHRTSSGVAGNILAAFCRTFAESLLLVATRIYLTGRIAAERDGRVRVDERDLPGRQGRRSPDPAERGRLAVVGARQPAAPVGRDSIVSLARTQLAAGSSVLVVGPPGIQKTPPVEEAMRPLKRLVAEAIACHEQEAAAYETRAVVAKARAKAAATPDASPPAPSAAPDTSSRHLPVCRLAHASSSARCNLSPARQR